MASPATGRRQGSPDDRPVFADAVECGADGWKTPAVMAARLHHGQAGWFGLLARSAANLVEVEDGEGQGRGLIRSRRND